MIYRYQWERAVWLIVIVAAIAIAVNFLLGYVGGTALEYDPLGPTWLEQLQQRAAEWNINKLINETLETAERFEK